MLYGYLESAIVDFCCSRSHAVIAEALSILGEFGAEVLGLCWRKWRMASMPPHWTISWRQVSTPAMLARMVATWSSTKTE